VLLDAFGEVLVEAPAVPQEADPLSPVAIPVGGVEEVEDEEEDGDIDAILEPDKAGEPKKKKKERQKRRQLVFDEELGEVVSKRRRKGRRARDDWDDFLG
jgi:hypothetical protein